MPQTRSGLNYATTDLRPPWRTSGMPVLFHHGIGTSLGIWSEWIPIVASRHPVARFDMRGFGASTVPAMEHRWSMDELVADVWDVADAAEAEAVHLVGESIGGTIALAAALARPDRVASVTISNASYKGEGIGQIGYWRAQFSDGGAAGWGARMMDHRFAPGAGDPEALAWFAQEQARTPAHVALGLAEVLAGADLTDALRRMDLPLSIVLPDSSPFVPVKHGAELHDLAPNARLRVVPGARHGLPFTHAKSEAEWLLRFLAEVES
jgi:pimeloyl-ACP methyl ester carboxylesterase